MALRAGFVTLIAAGMGISTAVSPASLGPSPENQIETNMCIWDLLSMIEETLDDGRRVLDEV